MNNSIIQPEQPSTQATTEATRRKFFIGASVFGVAAAAAVSMKPAQTLATAAKVETLAKPDDTGGYQLSEHVRRYYETARV